MLIRYTSVFNAGKQRYVLLFVLLFSFAFSTTWAQQTVVTDSASIVDSDFGPDHVSDPLFLSRVHFYKPPDNRVNFGLTGNDYHFILLKLSAETPNKNLYLSIDNTSIDSIEIYRIFPGEKLHLLYQGGDLISYKNKIYNWHTAPLEISKTPSFYLFALKAAHENINIRYEVLDKDELHIKYQNYDRIVFIYIGVICLIFLIITVAFLIFGKRELVAYLAYIMCFAGWVLAHYGRLFPLLYPELPVINKIVKPLTTLGASFFLLMVLRIVFKQLLQSRPRIHQIVRRMMAALGLLIALMFLFLLSNLDSRVNYFLVLLWHIGLIGSILLVIYIPVTFYSVSLTAKIFSVAMFAISLSASLQVIATVGFINNFFINEHGLTVGSLLEITIMAFGLFFSLLEEMKHKEQQVLSLQQEQTETLQKLITVQNHERKRIAADLHDNIGPLLAALKINFGRMIHNKDPTLFSDVVAKTESIIDDAIAEIRNVAHNLMPRSLSSNGLISTLNEYLESIGQLYNKEINFHHEVESIPDAELQTNLYRIICELVLNAARHSNASQIDVDISAAQDSIFVSIADNGKGFQQISNHSKTAFGLQSVKSRVYYLKGKFSLRSEKDAGTTINIEVPLQFNNTHVNSF